MPGRHWLAENLIERRRYKLTRPVAAALVAACRPRSPQDLARQLAKSTADPRETDYWERVVDSLLRHDLIVEESSLQDDPDLMWLLDIRRRWSRFGWHEAVEYHALSFDYPCVDYSEAIAITTDQSRMRGYQAQEPDTDRVKLDYLDRPETPLAPPSADMPSGTAQAVWDGSQAPARFDSEALAQITAMAFGATGTLTPRTDSAPLLRRSSPSGGGRHPSEGYLIVRDVPGVERGWHHVTMRPFGLRRIEEIAFDDGTLHELFPETIERFPFEVKALYVVTSVFERNMYRYREPRTFRTVHMDAGHVAGALRLSARSLGLTAGIYYCDFAVGIERALGLDGMREGYMLTVAIADGV
ncbi:SagB/ThcOx family dehydrogenase [Planomonospora algeriensis]